jgi:hypothetical protein
MSGQIQTAGPLFDAISVRQAVALIKSDLHAAMAAVRDDVAGADEEPWPALPEIGNDLADLLRPIPTLVSRAQVAVMVGTEDARISGLETVANAVAVPELMAGIKGRRASAAPELTRVAGAFFTSVLLFEGWWKQPEAGAAAWGMAPATRNTRSGAKAIQAWLNHGFEQWGPSLSLVAPDRAEGDLFAQLGYGDEANSLPVIIGRGKARHAREILEKSLVAGIEICGLLCHRDHIATHFSGRSQAIARQLLASEPQFEHFLLVEDDKHAHQIMKLGTLDFYSAYLWQCLVPSAQAGRASSGALSLSETIFLWEHTNLADADSVKFNYDALMHKKEYLERVLGSPLSVLQHSYPVDHIVGSAPVVPLVSTAAMLELFARARDTLSRG